MSDCCSSTAVSDIEKLEQEIQERKERLAELRRSMPAQAVRDYEFDGHDGRKVRLSQLFNSKQDLIVIHNMGTRCPMCTMWADGFNGILPHLEDRAGFVVISNDDVEAQKKFKASRDWNFAMVSAKGTNFFEDMGFVFEPGSEWGRFSPGVSTFKKDANGGISRVARADFGPGDDYCVAWHLFDLLEKGADGWEAKFRY